MFIIQNIQTSRFYRKDETIVEYHTRETADADAHMLGKGWAVVPK